MYSMFKQTKPGKLHTHTHTSNLSKKNKNEEKNGTNLVTTKKITNKKNKTINN